LYLSLLFGAFLLGLGILLGRIWGGSSPMVAAGTDPAVTVAAGDHAGHDHEGDPSTWTCSMHPSVQQDGPGSCPLCGMDLIPLEEDSDDAGPRTLSMSESSRALAEIATTVVETGLPEAEIRMVGELSYDETRDRSLTARFPGRIEALAVGQTGRAVAKGEVLAEIYSPELRAALAEYRALHQRDPDSAATRGARERLRLWDLTAAQIKELREAPVVEDTVPVRSPIGGVVVEKHAREGDYLTTGESLFRVVDLSELWLELEAFASDYPWLAEGQEVVFTVDSLPGEDFTGTIVLLEPTFDRASRTVAVRVEVPNPGGRLRPGMFARGTVRAPLVVAEEEPDPILLPSSAVLRTGERGVVYVRVPEAERPTFEGRTVELGPRAGDFFVVREGLEPGEEVVTRGAFKIDGALQIQAKPSMMNPGEGEPEEPGLPAVLVEVEEAEALLPDYFTLQEALAGDDLEAARKAVAAMQAEVAGGSELDGLLADMAAAPDLEALRKPAFEALSNGLITTLEGHPEILEEPVYRMNCPMVYQDRGADWLQPTDDLRNPYYGAMMLQCGSTVGTLE
jgi:Cu(I)/Ag(I) efflux system membrane fusion protein